MPVASLHSMLSAPNAKATFTGTASDEESSLQLFVLLLTLFLTLGIFTPGGIEINNNNNNNNNVSYICQISKHELLHAMLRVSVREKCFQSDETSNATLLSNLQTFVRKPLNLRWIFVTSQCSDVIKCSPNAVSTDYIRDYRLIAKLSKQVNKFMTGAQA